MKTKITFIIFIISLLLIVATTGNAQEQAQTKFGVSSVNLIPGWYQPAMDYWNDIYLPTLDVTEKLSGNIALGGNITFALPYNLRARVGASYWSDKAEGNESSTINSLQIGFTRFRLGAFYNPIVLFNDFHPYVGIEGQFYLIKNKLDNGTETTTQQGQDYSFAPVIGIDRAFGHVNVGVEFMYNLGSYIQEVSDGIGVSEQKVSINGTEVGVSVGYRF
jgi:outer membrane protein W